MDTDEDNPYRSPEIAGKPQRPIPPEVEVDWSLGNLDDPVTIASYLHSAEAEMLRMLLGEHGIRAHLTDSNIVNFNRLFFNAVGGVKLNVARRDAPRAVLILQEQQEMSEKVEDQTPVTFQCEECNAEISFPGHRRGKVETCPKCREYVDVPDA